MSRRATDSRGERALAVFLDQYFYSKEQANRLLAYAKRIYEKQLQIRGIDVLLEDKRKIDEKAQLYYINRPVDSFAFEIDYYDEEKESVVDGWFVSQSNETDEYLLLWIENARTTKINRLVSEDFEVVKADLIEKKHLKKYLEGIGITDCGLKKKAIEMRDSDVTRVDFDENCHLTYSTSGFSERPINLVIRKNILDNLSLGRFVITKEEVKAI